MDSENLEDGGGRDTGMERVNTHIPLLNVCLPLPDQVSRDRNLISFV